MQTNRQVRIIKKDRREAVSGSATVEMAMVDDSVVRERDARAVVSGWVREHREGVKDYRRALATLFSQLDAPRPA
jgi:hypothetical protein